MCVKNNKYGKYILIISGLVLICFVLTLATQIGFSLMPPSPFEPAYYGWPDVIAGRRVLFVINTDMDHCDSRHEKTIIVETLDTVTQTFPSDTQPTLSAPQIVSTLDPSGHTSVMERPYSTWRNLFTDSLYIRAYGRNLPCTYIYPGIFSLMLTPNVTMQVFFRSAATPTPLSTQRSN